jgi:catechol-2,3-dioxygenase
MIKTTGVRHVHLYVKDLERSARFYRDAFGFVEKMRFPSMIFLGRAEGEDSIALHQDPAMEAKAGDNGGDAHFGMYPAEQSDLEGMIAEGEAAGGRLVEQASMRPVFPTYPWPIQWAM